MPSDLPKSEGHTPPCPPLPPSLWSIYSQNRVRPRFFDQEMTRKVWILRCSRRLFIKKCLFPLDAFMVSCRTWSKNLGRTLRQKALTIVMLIGTCLLQLPNSKKFIFCSGLCLLSRIYYYGNKSIWFSNRNSCWILEKVCQHFFLRGNHWRPTCILRKMYTFYLAK